MQKPERRIVITIFVNPVLTAKEDSVRDKAEGIGGDILPVLVRGEREVVALLLVTGNTFFSQYPDVVLLVFGQSDKSGCGEASSGRLPGVCIFSVRARRTFPVPIWYLSIRNPAHPGEYSARWKAALLSERFV